MNWRIAFQWTRDIFAIFGLLGILLAASLAWFLVSAQRDYEERAKAPPPAPSLKTAEALSAQAGIASHNARRMFAGVNPDWNGSPRAEAYCLEAWVDSQDRGWTSMHRLEPLLSRSADAALELAHSKLECIPTPTQAREARLEVKLISLHYEQQRPESVTVALRDAIAGRVYLVATDSLVN